MEREREREDFQQEIQRLEEQLRQAARPRSPGLRDSHVSQPTHSPLPSLPGGAVLYDGCKLCH